MAERKMKDEFDAIREAQALREMSDDPVIAKRAMDQTKQMEDMMDKIKKGKAKGPRNLDGMPSTSDVLRRVNTPAPNEAMGSGMKKGGTVKKMAKGGSVGSASKRADGCATKGKTKGRII